MSDPLIGRQLGKYQIQQEIGRGGMARVYRATDTVLQRPVALKVLAPSLSADPEFARRFEREAITAANLRHPAIVTIFDVGEAEGLRYIAMEYIAGRTLNDVLEEVGKLPMPLTIAVLAPVADALDFAHNHGMVHRDVKPHNIMLDTDGRVLLTDFGIAIDPAESTERLTRTGMFMGTPEYISPEQAQAQPLGGRSDQYSLGIVAYEMLAGRVPFEGGTPQQIMAHVYQAPPQLTGIDRSLPPELDQIFGRVLAKDPTQRFERVGLLVESLRYVARRYGLPVATRDDLARLAVSSGSSAGQATVAMRTPASGAPTTRTTPPQPTNQPPAPFPIADVFGPGQTSRPPAQPNPPPPTRRPDATLPMNTPPSGSAAANSGGYAGAPRQPGAQTGPRPAPNRGYAYPAVDDQFVPPPRLPRRRAYDDDGGGSVPWALIGLGAVALITLVLVVILTRDGGSLFANSQTPPVRSPFDRTATPTALPPTFTALPTQPIFVPPTPTLLPGITPTPEQIITQTEEPTTEPTAIPTTEPTAEPTLSPTVEPTLEPTLELPTEVPTLPPPTVAPTVAASVEATPAPTAPGASAQPSTPGGGAALGGGGTLAFFADTSLTLQDETTGGNNETFKLVNFEPQAPPAVSPDGKTVLLDLLDVTTNARQIYVWNRKVQLRAITQGPAENYHPAWSPDGSAIVFVSTQDDQQPHLFLMNPDGSNIRPLTQGPYKDQYPSFAPVAGDTRIIFESTRDSAAGDTWSIWTIDAQGGPATRLSPADAQFSDRSPRWSPDARTIAFVSDRDRKDGGFDVYTQQVDSSTAQRLTEFTIGSTETPTWSPDGTLIAFTGDETGSSDIYLVDVATKQLLPSPANKPDVEEQWPSWSK